MKKLLSLVLVLSLTLSLFACSSNKVDGAKYSGSKQKIVVALNAAFPPYEYKEGNEIVGIDPDMTREIGMRLGMDVEFLDIEFDSIIAAIQSGKADIAATGMTVTEDRKNYVRFTDMYQDAVQVIIVKENSQVKTKDDLKGKLIAVQSGTTGDMYCTDDFGDANILRFSKIADGVQALLVDKVDACVVDDQVAKACIEEKNKQNNGEKLVILPSVYVEEHYAMALNKNATELYDKVNGALKDMMSDGTLKEIKSRYIND